MSTKITIPSELEEQLCEVIQELRPLAEQLEASSTYNLKGSYMAIFKQCLIANMSARGEIADKRTRQWAISFELHLMPSGAPMLQTPQRRVIRPHSYEIGDYYTAQGLDDAARYLASQISECVQLDGFSDDALRAALRNLRGPISVGHGHAVMRRTVTKPAKPGRALARDNDYHLVVDVMRLDVAEERYPREAPKFKRRLPAI